MLMPLRSRALAPSPSPGPAGLSSLSQLNSFVPGIDYVPGTDEMRKTGDPIEEAPILPTPPPSSRIVQRHW
jgi:hypothetical protein